MLHNNRRKIKQKNDSLVEGAARKYVTTFYQNVQNSIIIEL